MNTISLQLVSPDKEHFIGSTEMVVLPGEEGDFSVLPDHAPIITYLRPGEIKIILQKEDDKSYFVAGGFVKVDKNNCQVLVDYIKESKDLNLEATKKELSDCLLKVENGKDHTDTSNIKERIDLLKEEVSFIENQIK